MDLNDLKSAPYFKRLKNGLENSLYLRNEHSREWGKAFCDFAVLAFYVQTSPHSNELWRELCVELPALRKAYCDREWANTVKAGEVVERVGLERVQSCRFQQTCLVLIAKQHEVVVDEVFKWQFGEPPEGVRFSCSPADLSVRELKEAISQIEHLLGLKQGGDDDPSSDDDEISNEQDSDQSDADDDSGDAHVIKGKINERLLAILKALVEVGKLPTQKLELETFELVNAINSAVQKFSKWCDELIEYPDSEEDLKE